MDNTKAFHPILWLALAGLLLSSVALQAADYHQTKAQKGDGVYSLLRRYKLDGYRCNFDQFYRLNKLTNKSHLIVGRNYFLPIEKVKYNGQNIRSSTGITDWDTAVKIRDYNRELEQLGLTSGPYERSLILFVPHHIQNCPTPQQIVITQPAETQPAEAPASTSTKNNLDNAGVTAAGSGQRMFPIFGTSYAYTPLLSTQLRGKVYYVSAGHGGPDPGAIGHSDGHQLCEDEYAYDVALRLCRNLISHGATAYMVNRDPDDGIRDEKYLKCDSDEVLWGDIRQSAGQKARLTQRSNVVNGLYEKHTQQGVKDQTLVCIHVDSRNKSQRTDLFFYHLSSSSDGRDLAQQMQSTMREKYRQYRSSGEYHGTVTARDLHMLRECKPTGVYIELANIRNSTDQQRIVLKRNRELLADWLLEGLMGK